MLGALKGHLAPAIISASEDNEFQQSLRIIDERTGREYKVPIKQNTIEAKHLAAICISGRTSLRLLDPGLTYTCIGSSQICFIDGEKGILRYRGYPIEQLAESCSYEEVCFLLLFGELPSLKQLKEFNANLFTLSAMPTQIKDLIRSFDRGARPISMFCSAMVALSACNDDQSLLFSSFASMKHIATRNTCIIRAIAAGFTIAANIIRHLEGLSFVEPQEGLGLVENFLYMIDKQPHSPVIVRALELLFILHAEHEANSSTAAVRSAAATHTNLFASLAAGVAVLSGNKHGSANEAVVQMLQRIEKEENVQTFIEKVKRREERLMGFGHRVYKSYDPRAFIIRQVAAIVFNALGTSRLSKVALALEEAALKDVYFTSRRLYPNIDFYSGVVYRELGFEVKFFSLFFAASRLAGWCAHLKEFYEVDLNKEEAKMQRPQLIYKGQGERFIKDKNPQDREQIVSASQTEILHSYADRRRINPKL